MRLVLVNLGGTFNSATDGTFHSDMPGIFKVLHSYTINTVEGYHRQLRKVTKNKGVFTSDTSLEKLVYLVFTRIRKKWTQPVQNCGQTPKQLAILFPAGSGSCPDIVFRLEFFDDIDNLAEPLGNIEGHKTAPKYKMTQFSLHYLCKLSLDT